MTRISKFRLHLIATVSVLATLEGVSFAGFHVLNWIRPGSVVEISMQHHFREKVDPKFVAHFVKKHWDSELAWVGRPLSKLKTVNRAGVAWSFSIDRFGAREHPNYFDTLIATTFGDSFTFGYEVDNNQTWQSYASSELKSTILNFGVPGYGTLQAVMRAERVLQSGPVAPVTILGIHEVNLNRSVMAFEPFQNLNCGKPQCIGFRPTIRFLDGKIVEFQNPWQNPDATVDELRELAISAADHDFWAQTRAYRMSFPYTLAVLGAVYHRLRSPYTVDSLWNSHEGQEIMKALIKRFVTAVRKKRSAPIILFIPGRRTLENMAPPPYVAFRDSLRVQYPKTLILDVNERDFDRAKFNILPFDGHTSPYGNRVIANVISEALRDFEPIPSNLPSKSRFEP